MDETLAVLMGTTFAGTLERTANHLLRFEYDRVYAAADDATPISLSMPLAVRVHADTTARRTVSNVLWGLLPDNELVLDRWARHYQVRATSPFFLLGTPVGEDCAGAVSFCRSDVVQAHLDREGSVEWLADDDVATLLSDLRRDRTTWLGRDFAGQFSLAGAQAKTALVFEDGRWGRPTGVRATTHVLKPASAGRADQDINEHLCLEAARRAGLVTTRSRIARFGDETAIVIERYDRIRMGRQAVRVHQEDACQALGIHPADKYESNGGPSAKTVASLLRRTMPPVMRTMPYGGSRTPWPGTGSLAEPMLTPRTTRSCSTTGTCALHRSTTSTRSCRTSASAIPRASCSTSAACGWQ